MTEGLLPYTRASDLPLFERPPVTEVAMGIQFQGPRLRAIDLSELVRRFADRYPLVEEHPPVALQVERFEQTHIQTVEFEFFDRPPIPRVILLSAEKDSLVQVQSNSFHCAWRRVKEDTPYPRYESFRKSFVESAEAFAEFVNAITDGGEIPVTQAEIIYNNDLPSGHEPIAITLSRALTIVEDVERVPRLSEAEEIRVTQRFAFENSHGIKCARLHVVAEPVVVDAETLLRLSLTYRGEPHTRFPEATPGIPAIMRFLDEGHDQIVRAFAASTTAEVQAHWGRVR